MPIYMTISHMIIYLPKIMNMYFGYKIIKPLKPFSNFNVCHARKSEIVLGTS